MSLGSDEVVRIAHLARLALQPEAVDGYARDLSSILAFVEQLEAVDTQGVQPMAHPQDATQRLRADEVTETNQRERFQQLAPQAEAGLYRVPKVIE
ncbi:Asp-tRNA(Asn)/Glu-tRNA(Gln) amidotransferase subunit GatC [Acidihalobacter ferrooxydans]|uniref:Aspartyl/glutamyl-tRNA(Asn/Gln) amidotransferase subunit C n=1 Tax=Acidihalobacter ferrooxydans TaxID=1765967 RepID=A0A1P8UDU0_9GAMM|nr:Asp-tRNA(Asn)/Glu-tRNA(Gln) amidotransferase subunit GatC [Acidihalobacter ferrooxydans]APZ42031.1 asparaginyl/glutamyl-tRNA amidotransferase subunit C [Acidihalobacter ferrooxydans]